MTASSTTCRAHCSCSVNGEPPGSYALLLSTEQGLGDAIQFARVTVLARAGHAVRLLAPPMLAPLFAHLVSAGNREGVTTVPRGIALRWAPLMSVPAICGLTTADVPSAPYPMAQPQRTTAWATRLGRPGYKIGIAWAGNPAHPRDQRRSPPLAAWEPLASLAGVRLLSLQKQPGASAIAEVPFGGRIETVTNADDVTAEALLDAAALIVNLDPVITGRHPGGPSRRRAWPAGVGRVGRQTGLALAAGTTRFAVVPIDAPVPPVSAWHLGGGVHGHGCGPAPVTSCRLAAVRCPDPTASAAGETSLAPIGMAECR